MESLGRDRVLRTLQSNNTEAARNIRKYKDTYSKREAARRKDPQAWRQREALLRQGRSREEFEQMRAVYLKREETGGGGVPL